MVAHVILEQYHSLITMYYKHGMIGVLIRHVIVM